jgi:hypothetical protein
LEIAAAADGDHVRTLTFIFTNLIPIGAGTLGIYRSIHKFWWEARLLGTTSRICVFP